MSDFQKHVLSVVQTFVGSFITGAAITLSQGAVQWNSAFWFSILTAGVVAGIKAISYFAAPPVLGGKSR